MPTVNAIAQQKSLTADVSSKIFRTDFEASRNSLLIKGPMESANEMITSTFGLRSNISEMLGTYTEEKDSFDSQFDRTMSSLKESADKLKESVQEREDERIAGRQKAQETERDRREVAERFADDAREKLDEAQHDRKERADQLAEITRERLQNSAQGQQERMEQIAEENRERLQNVQNQREQAQRTVETREQAQQVTATREQAQAQQVTANREQAQTDATVSGEELRERIQADEQTLRGRTEELANATRERAQTQRERTERFAQEYLVSEDQARTTQARTTEREVMQNLDETRDENANAALSNVRNLVNRFNDAVTYFNENRGVSDRMSALAGSFGRTETFAEPLNAVGITVNDNGRLTVNETRLADALNENSANVNALLGRNGLAGRLDRNIELATSQRDNLFPSVTDYVNNVDNTNNRRNELTESLYAAQLNQTAALARENPSNFVNMFT